MTEDSRRKPYFPIFLDLSEKQAVIIGGGTIAERRLRILRGFVGSIRIVAPKITDAVREMIRSGGRDERPGEEALCGAARIIWRAKRYEADDLTGADLVLACTDDPERNSEIYRTCRELRIPVNDCSDKSQCTEEGLDGLFQDFKTKSRREKSAKRRSGISSSFTPNAEIFSGTARAYSRSSPENS